MIKFVLVFIAVILMILGIYNYSNQSTEIHTPKPTISEKKKEVKEIEKVSIVTQEVKEKKSSVKNITALSPKVVSELPIHVNGEESMQDEEEIGKGLTLESIENADVSDEEKKVMKLDMVYNQSKHMPYEPTLNEEEIINMLENDMKNGLN